MLYLSAEQILFIHFRLIEITGGTHGVRDLGSLQAAVARPKATFGGLDLYPDLYAKAAAMMESLIRNHPFIDGNERSAIAAAGLMLRRNGRALTASQEELYEFTMRMATGEVDAEAARDWLARHADV
jgi:death-on-curing protein